MGEGRDTKVLQELLLYLSSAARWFYSLVSVNLTLIGNQDVIACNVINPDHIDVEFETIGGLDNIKQALYELVILPLRRPELFSYGKLLTPQKWVLLYGPPGTGKTMLAKAIAKESGVVFINVRNYGDAMLTRFLVARSINPMKAAKMLVSWKKWREEFVPLGFIPDFEGPNELKAKKNYLQGPTPIQE
ncbi:hypothetical protein IFM89_002041 [Coptis chinensis]|uniref:ATPase AAA-type core domain-containing protein n=1 Tax=Coptis chinensis TaxID=261450 RepID=A0A835GTN6_9MAGN|nr:hypothetical protein IFM89_002041 [Coptis chinensis]